MIMLFSNFTERARIAISEAHDTACALGHRYIGSEHLVAGLMKEGSGVAAKVLENAGITADQVVDKIAELTGSNEPLSEESELPLTPRTKRILQLAAMEARQMGHNYIGTEHILIAVLRDSDSVGVRVLLSLGLNLQHVYEDIAEALNSGIAEPSGQSQSYNSQHKRRGGKTATPTLDEYGRDLTELEGK